MIEETLIDETRNALESYRQAIARASDTQEKEDYLRLVAITERMIAAMEVEDIADVKLAALGFSRQVSDSFATQPFEFKALAHKVAEVKRHII